jgi:NDP-sugar pyrophosphorylase family protein
MTDASVAYILAAGLGTRLRPLTHERPKPLVEVGGVPLLHLALAYAKRAGAERVAINTHHLHPAIEDALGGDFLGTPLTFSYEPEVLGTGGGLKAMWKKLGEPEGPALVLNADALIDVDVRAMLDLHAETGGLATLAVKDTPDKAKFGLLGSDENGQVLGFAGRTKHEGPFADERMFCGVHVVESEVFASLPDGACGVNTEGYPKLIDAGRRVQAFDLGDGYFCDVGTPARLLEANRAVLGEVEFKHLALEIPGVHPDAEIADAVSLRQTSVGPGANIEPGVTLTNCCVQSGATVETGAVLEDAIIYPGGVIQAAA